MPEEPQPDIVFDGQGQPDPNMPPKYSIGPDKKAYPMVDLMNDEDACFIVIKAAVPG